MSKHMRYQEEEYRLRKKSPEEHESSLDWAFENQDPNQDGKISLNEYLSPMHDEL